MNQELAELKDLKELKQVQRELAGYHRSFKYIVQFVQHLNEFGTSFPLYNPVENISIQTYFSGSLENPDPSAREFTPSPDVMYSTTIKFTLWHTPVEVVYKKEDITIYMNAKVDGCIQGIARRLYFSPGKDKKLTKPVLEVILEEIKGFFPPENDNLGDV